MKETKRSGAAEKGFNISQCFFTLPTFNNSISLVVTQKGDGAGAAIRKSFGKRLSTRRRKAKERGNATRSQRKSARKKRRAIKTREEEEEEAAHHKRFAGVGDEAFWTGSRVGGALYVLKGSTYLRVSVGGAGGQQSKINKSKRRPAGAKAALALF